jgi:pyruvate dehydrogenase E2 component (dihydrolipoamide acetyltransferase)
MSETKVFLLPDLGEGLPDAEIVEWNVKVGDTIRLDEPLVSMETAKAVVEVPAPCSGKVIKLAGGVGDIVATGSMLAEFELDPNLPQRAEAQDTGHHHGGGHKGAGQPVPAEHTRDDGDAITVNASDDGGEIPDDDLRPAKGEPGARADAGTVVGAMQSSDRVHVERVSQAGGVKAMPAVRALAKKLGVDLARVAGSGADGVITLTDVKQAKSRGDAATRRSAAGEGSVTSERHTPPARMM